MPEPTILPTYPKIKTRCPNGPRDHVHVFNMFCLPIAPGRWYRQLRARFADRPTA